MKMKPVVRYDPKAEGTYIVLDEKAVVWVLDHPSSPHKPDIAYTSRVIEIGERGVFQTRNSIYVPAELSDEWFAEATGKFKIQPVTTE